MEDSKINYQAPDGTRSQVTIDGKLVDLWGLATGRQDLPERDANRIIADEIIPRALRMQSAEMTKTKRVERELMDEIACALHQDWTRNGNDQPDLLMG
jgi:hypothetical protein